MKLQKPTKKQVIITSSIVLFICLVIGFYKTIEAVSNFFESHTVIKNKMISVEIKKPFEIITRSEAESRKEKEKIAEDLANKCINDYLHPKDEAKTTAIISPSIFFDRVWQNESTRGKDQTAVSLHMYCRAKGMWNEIGYNPQDKYCFRDEEEARLFVPLYIKRNCSGATLDQCLCYWNKGSKDPTCAYSEGRLSAAN